MPVVHCIAGRMTTNEVRKRQVMEEDNLQQRARRVDEAVKQPVRPLVVRNARIVDANGTISIPHGW